MPGLWHLFMKWTTLFFPPLKEIPAENIDYWVKQRNKTGNPFSEDPVGYFQSLITIWMC